MQWIFRRRGPDPVSLLEPPDASLLKPELEASGLILKNQDISIKPEAPTLGKGGGGTVSVQRYRSLPIILKQVSVRAPVHGGWSSSEPQSGDLSLSRWATASMRSAKPGLLA